MKKTIRNRKRKNREEERKREDNEWRRIMKMRSREERRAETE